jgi:hypothetical protein
MSDNVAVADPLRVRLAVSAVSLIDHPDLAKLEKRATEVLAVHGKDDLGLLAQEYVEGDEATKQRLQKELEHAGLVVLEQANGREMRTPSRRVIGVYLGVLGSALIATTLWAWSFANAVVADGKSVRPHFIGIGFRPTAAFSVLLIVALTAALGSVAVMAVTFAGRSGRHTLEAGWEWWYATRPIVATAVALLTYMVVLAGLFDTTANGDRPELIVAAAVGALAGLFTDRILEKLRELLGQSPFWKSSTAQSGDES